MQENPKKKIYARKIFNSYLFQTESPSHPTKRGIQELPLALMNATATTVQPILVSCVFQTLTSLTIHTIHMYLYQVDTIGIIIE